MNDNEKLAEFASFCIENYKQKLGGVSGKKVVDFFEEYGLLDFLLENYDLLHTVGTEQLMEEIDRYLRKRGASC